MRKRLFALSKIMFVLGLVTFVNIKPNDAIRVNAQENKEEKCEKLYECYRSYYNVCFDNVLQDFIPRKIDAFGIIGLDDEWARLDSLATEFRNNPESQIFIVVYGGKVNKLGELKERSSRLTYYLTQNRNIDLKKLTIIKGGFREKFETELWLSVSEKISPSLTPTVDPEKVVYKGKMKPLPLDLGT